MDRNIFTGKYADDLKTWHPERRYRANRLAKWWPVLAGLVLGACVAAGKWLGW